ncbi:MAG: hypothetical protein WKG03_00025 [Telluria sp.]
MEYAQAREHINTGDLISVRTPLSMMNRVTQFFTGSYTHSGQALWMAGRLWVTELNGGRNHLIPLSQWEGLEFDVHAAPDGLTRWDMERAIMDNLGRKVDYGYLAFVAIGLVEWLKLNLVVKWSKILVCSGYSVKNWQDAGWTGAASRVISPTKLAGMVHFKFSVKMPQAPQIIPAPAH